MNKPLHEHEICKYLDGAFIVQIGDTAYRVRCNGLVPCAWNYPYCYTHTIDLVGGRWEPSPRFQYWFNVAMIAGALDGHDVFSRIQILERWLDGE